ncbi:hypothetical protein BC833DRAFT_599397 [Globomyces pollinis-pini]|nr:hypothetical protein BC833DRAFT_599397 [Globomyces pollinis-pini]
MVSRKFQDYELREVIFAVVLSIPNILLCLYNAYTLCTKFKKDLWIKRLLGLLIFMTGALTLLELNLMSDFDHLDLNGYALKLVLTQMMQPVFTLILYFKLFWIVKVKSMDLYVLGIVILVGTGITIIKSSLMFYYSFHSLTYFRLKLLLEISTETYFLVLDIFILLLGLQKLSNSSLLKLVKSTVLNVVDKLALFLLVLYLLIQTWNYEFTNMLLLCIFNILASLMLIYFSTLSELFNNVLVDLDSKEQIGLTENGVYEF